MGKHVRRSYETKEKIVKDVLNGMTLSNAERKWKVRGSTISAWKKKYLNGTLSKDGRGKPLFDFEEFEILKKSYALLKEIRSQQNK